MSKDGLFFFRIDVSDLLDFATDPEGENMTLLQFAKELKKGQSDIVYINKIIDEAHNYIDNKRKAGKKGGEAKRSSAKAVLGDAKAVLKQNVADPYPETETETETETESEHTYKDTRFRADVFLQKHCSNKQLIKDWLQVRKTKRAATTLTAMEKFIIEVEKSGLTCEQVLEICCEKSWQGFKSSWLDNNTEYHKPIKTEPTPKEIEQAEHNRELQEYANNMRETF